MAQKVATAYKMKSRRDNLPRPNCDGDGKADNKRQAFINSDTRRFKIQMGDMDPPPPLAGPLRTSMCCACIQDRNNFAHYGLTTN